MDIEEYRQTTKKKVQIGLLIETALALGIPWTVYYTISCQSGFILLTISFLILMYLYRRMILNVVDLGVMDPE